MTRLLLLSRMESRYVRLYLLLLVITNTTQSMLMHYIEEVKGVQQVMDQEEEIAMQEFAKFEEKLRQQKSAGSENVATTGG